MLTHTSRVGSWRRRLPVLVALVAGLVPYAFPPTRIVADEITVPCNTQDLVAAINSANANSTADTIHLAAACTYLLETPEQYWYGPDAFVVTTDITIEGHGASIARDPAAPPSASSTSRAARPITCRREP